VALKVCAGRADPNPDVNLSLPSQRLVPLALLGVLAVVFVAIVAGKIGGGGGESGGASATDPQQAVQRAFSAQSFKSGKFNATAQISFQNAPSPELASLAIKVNGAFDNDPAPPKSDLDLTVDAAGKPIHLGIVSTGKAIYVTLGNRAYRLPQRQPNQSKTQPQDLTALAALGINPVSWFENPTHAGTATVGGVETDHVTAQVNAGNMLDDLAQLASRAGDRAPVSKADLEQAKSGLKGGAVDLYTAKSDGSLRRLSAQAQIEAPQGSGKLKLAGSGTLAFDMQFTDVNKPQKIGTPDNVRSAGGLESAFNAQVIRSFTRPGGSSGGGSDQGGSGAGAGAPAPTLPGTAQKYLDCVEKARTNADVQQCAPLLQ
jgi:hypothetical protein